MIEVKGDLWTFPAGVIVVTTNGVVKRDGSLVMGGGCALEAAQRYPDLPIMLGQAVREFGNEPFWTLWPDGIQIVSFPTKHHWRDKSDILLIEKGASKIAGMTVLRDQAVVMPRPGCGLGGLKWDAVKAVIAPILDDRFHVIAHT
jgi:hypothetical protein